MAADYMAVDLEARLSVLESKVQDLVDIEAIRDLRRDFSLHPVPTGERFWTQDDGWAAATSEYENPLRTRAQLWQAAQASGNARFTDDDPGPFTLTGLIDEAFRRKKG